MLMNDHYYHELLKRYVVYFGSLFNDITIQRKNENDIVIQTITVPIAYGPRQKFIARLEEDPRAERSIAITLPRMSFEITGISYDASRKLNAQQKIYATNPVNSSELNYVYTPVPFNINFTLSVYSKNIADNLQIVEQILPYFTPEWTSSVILIPEMDIKMDVPVVLSSVAMSDKYEGPLEAPRYIINTIQFVMKGMLYGPVRNSGVIKRSYINIKTDGGIFTDLYVTSNSNPAFIQGDLLYQTNGKRVLAKGIVKYSTEDYIQLMDVSGTFNTSNTLISATSVRRANVNSIVSNQAYEGSQITITPALLANGSPTTNSALSIPVELIKETDDYGISIDIDEFE
jgi:hypothetical protein